jgi:hypothetical protein
VEKRPTIRFSTAIEESLTGTFALEHALSIALNVIATTDGLRKKSVYTDNLGATARHGFCYPLRNFLRGLRDKKRDILPSRFHCRPTGGAFGRPICNAYDR